jgi:two-component system sensor histidine kinase BaeS
MKSMNLSKKLFLSLVGLTGIILIVTLLLARWSFAQGFSDFVNAVEQQRLSRLANDVREVYQANNETWDSSAIASINRTFLQHSNIQNNRPGPKHRPPRPDYDNREERRDDKRQVLSRPAPPPSDRKNRPPPPAQRIAPAKIVTVLYDLNGNKLAGDNSEFADETGVIVNEYRVEYAGEDIALLKSWNTERFGSALGSRFRTQQLYTTIWIGLACLLLAAVLSFYWSRAILNPIQAVMQGINKLSSGNYKEKIVHQRKDEFGALMNNVNALANTLEQTKSAKSRWFADISHELRTPLSVLLGEIEAMQAGVRPLDPKNLASLEQEALLLKHLIDDLYQLSVSDLGALRYEFKPIELNALMLRHCESKVVLAKEAKIAFSYSLDDELWIKADKNRISQLITNLLTNSIKYTDPGGIIRLALTRENDQVIILLEDSAPSVSMEVCKYLFEPLYRIEKSRNREQGGAGLGLAICKNIIHAHKGSITAKPSALGGLQIRVALPYLQV